LVQLSNTNEALNFRDWFWSNADEIVKNGGSVNREFLSRIGDLIEQDTRVINFSKILYRQSIDKYKSENSEIISSPAFTTNTQNSEETIFRQRHNWSKFKLLQIESLGFSMLPYEKCICGSREKFKFCCGVKY
jgi:hypothetical protein